MLWCRFQNGRTASYGIVEGDTVIAVEGDPFSAAQAHGDAIIRLADVKLLVPVVPPTFYAIGSNYQNHVDRARQGQRSRRRSSTTGRASAIAPTAR